MATKTTESRLKASTGTRKTPRNEAPSLFDIEWDRESLSVSGVPSSNERSIDRLAQRVKAQEASSTPKAGRTRLSEKLAGRAAKGRYISPTLHSRFTQPVTYEDESLFGGLNEEACVPEAFDEVPPLAESIPWDDDSAYRRLEPPSLGDASVIEHDAIASEREEDPRRFYKKMRRASRSQASFRKSGVQRVEPLANPYESPPLRLHDDVEYLPEASEDRKVLSSFDPDEPDRPPRKKRACSRQKDKALVSSETSRAQEGPSLFATALAFLSRREYSRRELGKKLALKLSGEVDKAMIEGVLDQLEKLNYLSDQRYAQTRAKAKSRQLGDRRVRYELRKSGVSSETVSEAMEGIQESEPVRCLRVWSRRFQECPTDRKERDRQVRYLAYRGFSMESIFKVLRGEVELPEDDVNGGSLWD